ncbi:Structural maintenance of chromosomes protein 5, partial [Coemansia sp. RSA 1836]
MTRKGLTRAEQKQPEALGIVSSASSSDSDSNDDGDGEEEQAEGCELSIGRELANGNAYRPGSIMHISLTNFITYDRIEVRPGPHMNMIIGPNGTGKSSIVCAIALGLGENTSVMKRAKDISEFVKHGHAHGAIEITLAAGAGAAVRIRREIQRQGNKSLWKIDGRAAAFAEVQRRTRALRIQVNNLCQFLPQDRVVEFSKMSAQALLKQTQAAVGREDLQQLQEELVRRRAQERQAQAQAARLRGDTEALRAQAALLERDVQRWQERQTAESQLRVLTALVPVARYAEAKAAHDAAKQARSAAHAQYLAARDAPAAAGVEARLEACEAQAAASQGVWRGAGDARREAEQGARQQLARLERLDAAQRELRGEAAQAANQARRRAEQAAALRSEVGRLERALEEDRPKEGSDDDDGASALREKKLQLANELVALGDEQRALASAGRAANGDIERRTAQLRALDDSAARRRDELRRVHGDSVRALEWLETNRALFAQHVFAPACLEMAVRDARYAAAVEAVVSRASLRTFVAQSDADYHVFTREVNDGLGLRVSVASSEGLAESRAAPESREALAALGFGGCAADFVDAPRAVLAFLRARDHIHAVPVALGAVDHAGAARLALREYIADGTRYATARGRYGSHAATVTTARIAPHARLLGGGAESDDVRATRARLGAEIDALRDALAAGEAQMKRLARREQAARDAHRAAEEQDAALARARRARADALERWERQRVHVDSKRAQLAVVLAASTPSASVVDTGRTARALRANACDRAACLADAARHATAAASAVHALARGGLAGVGAARALADARRELSVLRDAAADAQAAFERASDAFARAKAAARAALEETRAATDGMTEAERQAVRDEQEARRLSGGGDSALESSAALETELATCRQRLSMAAASGVSAAAIAQLAERQARLAAMAAQAQQIDAELLH